MLPVVQDAESYHTLTAHPGPDPLLPACPCSPTLNSLSSPVPGPQASSPSPGMRRFLFPCQHLVHNQKIRELRTVASEGFPSWPGPALGPTPYPATQDPRGWAAPILCGIPGDGKLLSCPGSQGMGSSCVPLPCTQAHTLHDGRKQDILSGPCWTVGHCDWVKNVNNLL